MKHGYQSARKSLQLHCHSICYLLVAKCKHENGDVCVKRGFCSVPAGMVTLTRSEAP